MGLLGERPGRPLRAAGAGRALPARPLSSPGSKRSLSVCVLGAGASGLVAVKELLDEGHRVVCLEERDGEGGTFRSGSRGRYGPFRLTVSQHFMAYSSFPPSAGEPRRFWTADEYATYLRRFAERFDLLRHVRFGRRGGRIRRGPQGRLLVEVEGPEGVSEAAFDAVAVCKGASRPSAPRMPVFEGQAGFAGRILHSTECADLRLFEGKRVLCVGLGETSADVTVRIAEAAQSCVLSIRSRPVLVPRYPFGGAHTSDAYTSRIHHWMPPGYWSEALDSEERARSATEQTDAAARHRWVVDWNRSAESRRKPLQKNDDFVPAVRSGAIRLVHSGVRRIEGSRVAFDDGSGCDADVIVCCTGYEESSIPSHWIAGVSVEDVRGLYKRAFHPELGARVAFIGWARPSQGGLPACSEMVARYFALLCSGTRSLPPRDRMERTIDRDRRADSLRFDAPQVRTLVDYTEFMDDLADLIGCEPDPAEHLDDPELLYKLLCGSNIGACYRLRGPHSDPDSARAAIVALPVANDRETLLHRLPPALRARTDRQTADRVLAVLRDYLAIDAA